jgi:hypothetical protein
LQDSTKKAEEKRCERAVGWKVCLKIFEISASAKKMVILKMVGEQSLVVDMVGFPEGTTLS